MKKCPKCKQIFSDDYAFCLEDGSTLFAIPEEDSAPTIDVKAGDLETQVLPPNIMETATTFETQTDPGNELSAPTVVMKKPPTQTKWLYAIVGAMAAIIAVLAISFYFTRSKTPDVVTTNSNQTAETNSKRSLFNPSGVWQGEWTSEKGGLSEAKMTLNDDGANQISGFIVWTLRRSANPNKKEKVGMKAIEYVQGNYDSITRVISVTGYEKKDPNDLIVLDSYKITLSEDNNKLRGSTRNQGKWSGNLNLERAE